MITLEQLPFEKNALEPFISAETLDFHYGKHHKTYVENTNKLISESDLEGLSLEEIIKNSSGALYNNSAQVWNHSFYWKCLTPNSTKIPNGKILEFINRDFGSFEDFKEKFILSAINNFASGWTWLALNNDLKLEIINTDDAESLVGTDKKALLVIDVWEHAYYIDVRNARVSYINNFFEIINWDFVNENLEK